jgi:fructosamine-3-kinase
MSNASGPSCERSHIDTAILLVRQQGLVAAEGLQALGASATVAVPFVYYVGGGSLVMDALGPAVEDSPAFWQRLGEDIAALQASTRAEQHGWSHDNWLGGLPQRNTFSPGRLGGRR